MDWFKREGGVEANQHRSTVKSKVLYDVIDN